MDVPARLKRMWSGRSDKPLIALVSTLRGAQDHMRGVVWQPFALSLGIPMKSLGGLESALDLTRITAQPLFGSASDAVGRKKFLLLRELFLMVGAVFFIIAGSIEFLVAGIVLVGLALAAEPIWATLIAESSSPRGLGTAYSVMWAAYMAAGLFAPLSAGLLASSYGYVSVFYASAGIGLLTLLIIALRLREPNGNGDGDGITLGRIVGAFSEALRPPRHMWPFYLSMAVDGISFGIGSRLLYGMLTRSHGYTPCMLSLMATATTATWAIVQLPVGRLVDKLGYRRSLAISQSMSCFYLVAILMSQRFEVVMPLQALMGFSAALWVPAEQAWIASNVEAGRRGQHMGSYSAFRGLLAFPAPFVGGFLYDSHGFAAPMLVNLAGATVDVALIVSIVKDRASRPDTVGVTASAG